MSLDNDPRLSAVHRSKKRGKLHLSNPRYVTAQESPLGPSEKVLGVEIGLFHRAYPVALFGLNHVINDVLGSSPILVTYCPLCLSGLAFDRVVGSQELTFAVYGRLYKRVVIRDHQTRSLWTQEGEAIDGPLSGTQLTPVSIWNLSWGAWKDAFPATTVVDEALHYDEGMMALTLLEEERGRPSDSMTVSVAIDGNVRGFAAPAQAAVIEGQVGTADVVVFWDAAEKSASVFSAQVEGKIEAFRLDGAAPFIVRDSQDRRWTFFGALAAGGNLRLTPVAFDLLRTVTWERYHAAGPDFGGSSADGQA